MVVNIFYLSFIDMCWKQNVVLQFCAWEVREDGFNVGCKGETNTRNIRKNLFNFALPLVCLHAVCRSWGWGAMFPPDICRRLATGDPIAAVFSAASPGCRISTLPDAASIPRHGLCWVNNRCLKVIEGHKNQKWHHSNYVALWYALCQT